MIDGFTSVQAVRRAAGRTGDARKRPSHTTPPAREKNRQEDKKTRKRAARIGHTVIPAKYEIVCYECGYTFKLSGRVYNTICPKCHKRLKTLDYTIDREWAAEIKTIGTIEIKAGGVLKGAELTARDVILAGNAEEGTIACRRLELCPGARFDIATVKIRDLLIRSGGNFIITRKFACKNLEVEGQLKGRIFTDGIVTIRPGGFLRGELHGQHLVVQEGGGLKAKVAVGTGMVNG